MSLRPTGDRRQPRHPPTIDLQWSEVVTAVAVCDFRAYPAALLIAQSPERLGKPASAGGRPGDARRDGLFIDRVLTGRSSFR